MTVGFLSLTKLLLSSAASSVKWGYSSIYFLGELGLHEIYANHW